MSGVRFGLMSGKPTVPTAIFGIDDRSSLRIVVGMRDIGGGEGTGAAGRDMGGGGTLRAPDGRGGAAPKNEAGMSCSPRS
jgi:hypothetical protein